MAESGRTMAAAWWQAGQQALAERDWPRLEGCVQRLLELVPPQPDLFDLLGHALLMQGRCGDGLVALERAMALGARHFWTPHKLGDAHRGLQQGAAAAAAFELALAWGSDSPLTARNLLEVLHQEAPEQALQRLERFAAVDRQAPDLGVPDQPVPDQAPTDPEATDPQAADLKLPVTGAAGGMRWDDPAPWLAGASAAAVRVQGSELARWLCERGCPLAEVRAVLWRDALYGLELERASALLASPCNDQERVLASRLAGLLAPDQAIRRRGC